MKKFSKLLALLLATQLTLVCVDRAKSVHAAINPSEKINSNYSTVNEKIKEKANTLVEKYGVTSVQYAMMDDGNIISSGNSGVYSKNNNRSITSDTMYGIGSTSKTFTAAAIMKLVDIKKIDLDKPIINYIPEFVMKDERYKKITTRMLLNHSSGLMGTAYSRTMLWDDNDTIAHDKLLEQLKTQRLKAEPGKFSVYCNDGFTLAEILVEKVSGESFTDFVHENITIPLKMDNTKTSQDGFNREKLAKTYSSIAPTIETPPDSANIIGAGGIYSTAQDLCKFGNVFTKNGTLLSSNSVNQMISGEYKNDLWLDNIDNTETIFNYGLGFDGTEIFPFSQYGIKAIAKGGDTLLYHNSTVILPEYNMIAAVSSADGSSLYNEVLACNMLLDALKEKGIIKEIKSDKSFEIPTKTLINDDIKKYEGTYGASGQIINVKMNENGIMAISNTSLLSKVQDREYLYNGNGVFLNQDGSEKITFENKDGKIYLRFDSYIKLPGVGQTAIAQYIGQKLEENKLTAEVNKAWENRNNKKYFNITDKYNSQILSSAPPFIAVNFNNGYEMSNKIIDANNSINIVEIPVMAGRDTYDCTFFKESDIEYMKVAENILINQDDLKEISEGNSVCAVEENGYNVWYKINDNLEGKKITVKLPENSGFLVYTKDGVCTNQSALTKNNTATLSGGGYIMFGGEKGSKIDITIE
ncbi:beta-lactamase family protein [Clostridium botulinum]|uniref:serine hydrolase domain-containing protein n=1 Tax=unclassified Clostridium TaxID=2614128 RepID=UPI000504F8FD|nr:MULTISPECIES: serine hydrolase domain-containing protein [unclassified Clostridium]AIY79070.1 beta-lactamase family protein [Clostridium botulinum 202F]KAI3346011.1 beta-lactamase family protein [Clostridium botulinum]KFX55390.1 penicillin-binding protein [Clostridium botulinum]KON13423.1 penicillin-binding protein [Clostridium botulinum]MBY6777769.1 beta-lactamase family protein [Clostridium botulinum]